MNRMLYLCMITSTVSRKPQVISVRFLLENNNDLDLITSVCRKTNNIGLLTDFNSFVPDVTN